MVCGCTDTLLKRAKTGDRYAQEEYIARNIGLVKCIVKKFVGRGPDEDDLYQLGMLGLYKAMMKFDSGYNVQFSTYAVPMITGEIKRYLRDNGYIKISRSIKELSRKIKEETKKWEQRFGREPKISELAENLGINEEEIATALSVCDTVYSLDSETEDGQTPLKERFADEFNLEENVVNSLLVKDLLSTLDVRERQIIILRYYKGKTQQEIAGMLNISQVQVSRIEKKVIERLSVKAK